MLTESSHKTRMAVKQSMTKAITHVEIEAAKATIMAITEADNLVNIMRSV